MLFIAFLNGQYLYTKRLGQIGVPAPHINALILLLLIFGYLGGKLMYALKNPQTALLTDWQSFINSSGLSSQGWIIASTLVIMVFSKLSKVPLSKLLDNAAFPAIMTYALARVGCFLAGDDCYGQPSTLPWAMTFPEGVAPVLEPVHPLPIYEAIYALAIAGYLKNLEKKQLQSYVLFSHVLILGGACRFLVEFISINDIKAFGMTGSQIGALIMFTVGICFLLKRKMNITP